MDTNTNNGKREAPTVDPRSQGQRPPFDEKEQESPGRESRMKVKPDHGETSYVGHGRLEGRKTLITGADSGIGRAIAIAFAREGADVAIAYLSEDDDARETQRLVEEAGRQALLLRGDLADPAVCQSLVQQTVDAFGRIDILVNNAAHQDKSIKDFSELDRERVERTFKVNILALFELVRHALPHMPPGGAILNSASIQASDPSFHILDYATTKAAIAAFTMGLAATAIEKGIRVNAVAPGPVWTPLIAQSFEGDRLRQFGMQSPMKRPAQPAELAPAYVFLASDEARFVNGEILGVTGGTPL
jgi:NAD(P)-dependent dehydrogenase (short-subunit alcohol dehydrogenase family)